MATSTGRGGAGNIGSDPNTYADGGITREGGAGESDRAEYSAGRGGAGNILPGTPRPGTPRANTPRSGTPVHGSGSEMAVPETATRSAEGYENFHTGRGGGGNVHKDKYGGHSSAAEQAAAGGVPKESLLDKVKGAIGLDKK